METVTITKTGCYLDSHRGHYITRDAIQLAEEWGFITGSFEKFALAMYEEHNNDEEYPFEALVELCDEAVNWLNSGQEDCPGCDGTGRRAVLDTNAWLDKEGNIRCKTCTGSGQGPRIEGQNFPPRVPEGFLWNFEEGDFGLWKYDEDGNMEMED